VCQGDGVLGEDEDESFRHKIDFQQGENRSPKDLHDDEAEPFAFLPLSWLQSGWKLGSFAFQSRFIFVFLWRSRKQSRAKGA
jgi:hypothetical protein